MDTFDILRVITYEAGPLIAADELIFDRESSDLLVGIVLRFQKHAVYLEAQPDDDTLCLSLNPPLADSSLTVVCAADRQPWTAICGQECRWAWTLTNQQGFTDGVRVEFATQPHATFVEFVVAASTIHCHTFRTKV